MNRVIFTDPEGDSLRVTGSGIHEYTSGTYIVSIQRRNEKDIRAAVRLTREQMNELIKQITRIDGMPIDHTLVPGFHFE